MADARPPRTRHAALATRDQRIDFLRGVAILCVLLLHYVLAFGFPTAATSPGAVGLALRNALLSGNYGVTMFFVVSGYLITTNTLARWPLPRSVDVAAFYWLRAARLMPALLLALALIVTLGLLGVPRFGNAHGGQALPGSYFLIATLSVLTFWHNVLMQSAGYFNYCLNVYWSLSVEEVFYLAFPLALRTLGRGAWLSVPCLVLIVTGPLYRAQHADDEIYFMYGYLACFDAIALGCLAALCATRVALSGAARATLRIAAGSTMAAVYATGIEGHEVYGFTWLSLATAAFLVGCAGAAGPGWTTGRWAMPVRWLGRRSYECYLFHVPVLAALRLALPAKAAVAPWSGGLALFIALAALAAALVARFVADPCNAWLRAWYARRFTAG